MNIQCPKCKRPRKVRLERKSINLIIKTKILCPCGYLIDIKDILKSN